MRLAATVLSLLLLSPALVRAGDPAPFFADGFESGTTCAWSAPPWYDDLDGDDYGDAFDAGEPPVCTATTLVPNRLDCDDTDANVNPAAQEVCNDIEDDCDGLLDADDPSLQLPPCDNQQGVCAGSQSPAANCVSGFWQACTDADYASQTSAYETSETLCDGLDNDCDGLVDEGDC